MAALADPQPEVVGLLPDDLPASVLLQARGADDLPGVEVEQGREEVPASGRGTVQVRVRAAAEDAALRAESGVPHDGGGDRAALVFVPAEDLQGEQCGRDSVVPL